MSARVPRAPARRPAPRAENAAFYVVLEKKPDGAWQPVKVARAMPQETSPDRIVLKARAACTGRRTTSADAIGAGALRHRELLRARGPGQASSRTLAREKKLAALVAVDSGGNAAIKGLVIDGVLQYEEPLF